jgi:hypothetical protein
LGNFIFDTQILSWLGPPIEEVVRHDVGSATPLPFEVLDADAVAPEADEPAHDLRHRLGLDWTTLGAIRLRLPWPRAATLTADLVQFGLATYVGPLRFTIELDRTIDAEVGFGRDERNGRLAFTGGAAATRLNGEQDLAKRVSAVLRDNFFTGTIWVKGAGCGLTLAPSDGGSTLGLWTYARLKNVFGRTATTDAGEVLEIAISIQQAI